MSKFTQNWKKNKHVEGYLNPGRSWFSNITHIIPILHHPFHDNFVIKTCFAFARSLNHEKRKCFLVIN